MGRPSPRSNPWKKEHGPVYPLGLPLLRYKPPKQPQNRMIRHGRFVGRPAHPGQPMLLIHLDINKSGPPSGCFRDPQKDIRTSLACQRGVNIGSFSHKHPLPVLPGVSVPKVMGIGGTTRDHSLFCFEPFRSCNRGVQ